MRTDAIQRPTEREESQARRRGKVSFDIDDVIRRLRKAVKPHTQAAMFELRDEGFIRSSSSSSRASSRSARSTR